MKYILVLVVVLITCSCSNEVAIQTPLGITVEPGNYDPDLALTDAKFIAMTECAEIDYKPYIKELTVKITAAGSSDLPWYGNESKRPAKYIWGAYQPTARRAIVNENQTALGHEIGHYLMQMLDGYLPVSGHRLGDLPVKCGDPVDSFYNKKLHLFE